MFRKVKVLFIECFTYYPLFPLQEKYQKNELVKCYWIICKRIVKKNFQPYQPFASKQIRSLFFWFVYFTLDDIYKVKAIFIVFLDGTTGQYDDGTHHLQNSDIYFLHLQPRSSNFWYVYFRVDHFLVIFTRSSSSSS